MLKTPQKSYPFSWSPTLRALYLLSQRLGIKTISEAADYLNNAIRGGGDPALLKALTDVAAAGIMNAGHQCPDDDELWLIIEDSDNIAFMVNQILASQKKK
ncbi:MAG: hypothetical protein QXT25_03380 [Candidatus Anstonellaceae archaeon]